MPAANRSALPPDDRRRDDRVRAHGVGLAIGVGVLRRVSVVDVSTAGCAIVAGRALPRRRRVWICIRTGEGHVGWIAFAGRVVRAEGVAGVVFTRVPDAARRWLARFLDGAAVVESPDEPITAAPDDERRKSPRRRFDAHVHALGPATAHVLAARDLSLEAIRVAPLEHVRVGTVLRVSIPNPLPGPPVALDARVSRQDGAAGTVLHFVEVSPAHRDGLEALLEILPRMSDRRRGR